MGDEPVRYLEGITMNRDEVYESYDDSFMDDDYQSFDEDFAPKKSHKKHGKKHYAYDDDDDDDFDDFDDDQNYAYDSHY